MVSLRTQTEFGVIFKIVQIYERYDGANIIGKLNNTELSLKLFHIQSKEFGNNKCYGETTQLEKWQSVRWLIGTKHFHKSQNTSTNTKHFHKYKTLPQITKHSHKLQNTSTNTKHFHKHKTLPQITKHSHKLQNTSTNTKHLLGWKHLQG